MLPEGYIQGVARVSNIVEFVFPFDDFAKSNYKKWLEKNKLDEEEYMKEAQEVGTFVHLQIEKFLSSMALDTSSPLFLIHKTEIDLGIMEVIKLTKLPGTLYSEYIVIDKKLRYQGTIDLLRIDEETKTVWLYDWKTWDIAKKKYGLPSSNKKPYDKLKKVALQLSLYAKTFVDKGYKIGGLYVVWLHNSGCYSYELELYKNEDIENILKIYFEKGRELPDDIGIYINNKDGKMQVRINTNISGQAYTNAEIILEGDDYKDLTPEQKIEEAIKLQKYLLSKY